MGLSNRLREGGIDCYIDQYVNGSPPEGWQRWIETQVAHADFVLLVCTENYLKYYRELGAYSKRKLDFEGAIISQVLYDLYFSSTKFIAVIPESGSIDHVPLPFKGSSVYKLVSDYDSLYRIITGQPKTVVPSIGKKTPDYELDESQTIVVGDINFNKKPNKEDNFDLENEETNYIKKLNSTLQKNNRKKLIQVIGSGAAGKTALLKKWIDLISKERNIIAWSFWSQDSSEFFNSAFSVFTAEEKNRESLDNKGIRLAKLLKNENCVLILDGFEFFLNDDSNHFSDIADENIRSLLKQLMDDRSVPCVLASRQFLNEKIPTISIKTSTTNTNEELSTISLANSSVEPQFKANELAAVVAELIPNIKAGAETLVGIFGNWGRGKTYLMDLIWKNGVEIPEHKSRIFGNIEVIKIDFHAWKYQNTPAIWGFLYSLFLDEYISGTKTEEQGWFKRQISQFSKRKKTILLNIDRKGLFPVFWTLSVLILGIAWYFAITISAKLDVLSFLGLSGVLFLFFIYGRIPDSKKVIEDYTGKSNILDYLGTQKLIQDELKILLKRWIDINDNKKILLFIDDLDRCRIEKIIDVVDSIRVILEDPEISERLIVFIAIDERILKLSIKEKYRNLNSISSTSAERMSHEYLDKLFLIGVRLGNLEKNDRSSYIHVLTDDVYHEDLESTLAKKLGPDSSKENNHTEKKTRIKISNLEPFKVIHAHEKITLSYIERQSLTEIAELMTDSTPRQLKIFYFRFVLSKRLIKKSYNPYDKRHADYLLGKIINRTIEIRKENAALPISTTLVDIGKAPGLIEEEVDKAVEIVTTF